MAAFQLDEGKDVLGIVKDFPGQIYSFSDLHFDEAHQVMDALAGALDMSIISSAFVVRVTGNPTENYVADPRFYVVNLPIHITLL